MPKSKLHNASIGKGLLLQKITFGPEDPTLQPRHPHDPAALLETFPVSGKAPAAQQLRHRV